MLPRSSLGIFIEGFGWSWCCASNQTDNRGSLCNCSRTRGLPRCVVTWRTLSVKGWCLLPLWQVVMFWHLGGGCVTACQRQRDGPPPPAAAHRRRPCVWSGRATCGPSEYGSGAPVLSRCRRLRFIFNPSDESSPPRLCGLLVSSSRRPLRHHIMQRKLDKILTLVR